MPEPTDGATNHEVTRLLVQLRQGKTDAQSKLLPLIYGELRAIAGARLGPGPQDSTLGTTALVHEVFIKMFDRTQLEWNDRRHFFRVASMAMRQILVDRARARLTASRGGGAVHVPLDNEEMGDTDRSAAEVIDLERAMCELEKQDERLAQVVQLRYYGGLEFTEVAECLDVSLRTAKRDWARARAVLYDFLQGGGSSNDLLR